MTIVVARDRAALSAEAAHHGAASIRRAISTQRHARIVVATAASQIEFLAGLAGSPDIDWQSVEVFHLDEYVGLTASHPASFRRLLREHLIAKTGVTSVHLLDTDQGADAAVRAASAEIARAPLDVAFIGIGENGHLAFNDPPADFETTAPYLIVELDSTSRAQQVGEGWFATLDEVPHLAVSMSIRQILAAREILAIVPDERKARAVRDAVDGPMTPMVPASILREHPNATLYLDESSARLLSGRTA